MNDLTQVERGIVKFGVDKAVLYGGEPQDVLLCLSASLHYHCQKEKSATYESITSEHIDSFFSSFYLPPAYFHWFHITAVDGQQHLTPNYCCYFHVWHLCGSFIVARSSHYCYAFAALMINLNPRWREVQDNKIV